MKYKIAGGSVNVRSIYYLLLNLIFLVALNPYASPAHATYQVDESTSTATETAFISPTETLRAVDTQTPTLIPTLTESPPVTMTLPPTITTSLSVDDGSSLKGNFVSDEVLIGFRKRASREAIDQCLYDADTVIKSEIEDLNIFVLTIPSGKIAATINSLQICSNVRYVEPNYIATIADTVPSDPDWGRQYGLTAIRAPQGWDLSTGSTAVTIAIVDTGIDLSHPDLSSKIVPGYDFVHDDSIPQDDNGHGTHAAGIAAAASNNGIGIAGVSWGARVMPIKVLNSSGNGTFANVSSGIVWATDHGAQIINLSLGGSSPSQTLQDAVDYAYSKGVLVIASAGNSGSGNVLYPARYPNVIAVAATDSADNHAGFSNYGPEVDLAAPGVMIYSTWLGGGYQNDSGTSMSAPFVSGLAAVLWGLPRNGTPDVVAGEMENSALDLGAPGRDDLYGYGLIQVDRAIELVLHVPMPTFASFQQSPAQENQLLFTSTSTFAPTWTMTAAFTTAPASLTLIPYTPSATLISLTATPTPTPISFSTKVGRKLNVFFSPLFCCGISLILAGMFMLWLARKKHRKRLKTRF